MTLKIPIQEKAKMVGSLRFYGNDSNESVIISKKELVMDEKIYVAVTAKDLESKSSLVWAIQNTKGKEFCIVYVHQPIQILLPGAMFNDQKLRCYRKEKEKAHKNLNKYLQLCRQMQVNAETIYIEMDSIEKGILQVISQHRVRKLVMGAAADKHYSMRMRNLQSKKAIYIYNEAPPTCHIWFTCNGYLICTRETRRKEVLYLEYTLQNSPSEPEITKETGSSVPSSSIVKDDERIKVANKEAENSKREARIETSKRVEAEKTAIDAIKRAKYSESLYLDELTQRKETEKALRIAMEELEKMRSESETRVTESNTMIKKLRVKYNISMEALRRLKEEQGELEMKLGKLSKLKSNRQNNEPPHYFICPITKDVMEDPHVAADGFTYEREAIRDWFWGGHETSPMTNKRLPHTSLVPNLALRSAIQEWLQDSNS